jgi:hypothetical protein
MAEPTAARTNPRWLFHCSLCIVSSLIDPIHDDEGPFRHFHLFIGFVLKRDELIKESVTI